MSQCHALLKIKVYWIFFSLFQSNPEKSVLISDRICIKTRPFNQKTIFFNYFFFLHNFRNPLQSTDRETQMPGGMRPPVYNNVVSWILTFVHFQAVEKVNFFHSFNREDLDLSVSNRLLQCKDVTGIHKASITANMYTCGSKVPSLFPSHQLCCVYVYITLVRAAQLTS